MSHAGYLHAAWGTDKAPFLELVRAMRRDAEATRELAAGEAIDRLTAQADAWPGLAVDERAVVKYVLRLTGAPWTMSAGTLQPMRDAGLDDADISAVMMVASLFAFMNRLADGTGVTLLPDKHDLARELFGDEALAGHLAWGEPTTT